jgi:ribosomal peptide maturation radical SAM protein 1
VRVVLAAMPWHAVNRPSLAIGLLRGVLHRDRPDVDVTEYHGAISWVDYLLANGYGEAAVKHYSDIADAATEGQGDWIFAGCLYDDPDWRIKELCAYTDKHGIDNSRALRMRTHVEGFVEQAAAEILSVDPAVVGFTSTFMQNVPSLALARRLKECNPSICVVFGGQNCDGPMGAALHRNHRFVDFVVRGEGELVFPLLLDRIETGEAPADLEGVCWWDGEHSVANSQHTGFMPPARIPSPDFDAWYDILERSTVREFVTPELLLESSRGCWWGEKHQCTFCGLNERTITFRARPAEQVWEEITRLVKRYQILDLVTVDLILDMSFFQTLVPRLIEAGWDLRVHYEIKSNLRAEHIAALAAAGIVDVQPGVESLNTRVLKIMDKGVDGASNIRLLRDCEEHGLTVGWNYLYGFPREQPQDYCSVIEQMPALAHLQPPSGAIRVMLERFSPLFENPESGLLRRGPLAFYHYVYDLPLSELTDLAYFFESERAGITGNIVDALVAALDQWRGAYPSSYLIMEEQDEGLLIDDRRHGWPQQRHILPGWQAEAYRGLSRPRTAKALHNHLATNGHRVGIASAEEWLHISMAHGLVFRDGDTWVALATKRAPHRIADHEPTVTS